MAPKKNAAQAIPAPIKSDEAPLALRAVFVMPEAVAEDAKTSSPAKDAFGAVLPAVAEIQQKFPQRAGKERRRLARGPRQSQDRRR